jgi:hypothetical protein
MFVSQHVSGQGSIELMGARGSDTAVDGKLRLTAALGMAMVIFGWSAAYGADYLEVKEGFEKADTIQALREFADKFPDEQFGFTARALDKARKLELEIYKDNYKQAQGSIERLEQFILNFQSDDPENLIETARSRLQVLKQEELLNVASEKKASEAWRKQMKQIQSEFERDDMNPTIGVTYAGGSSFILKESPTGACAKLSGWSDGYQTTPNPILRNRFCWHLKDKTVETCGVTKGKLTRDCLSFDSRVFVEPPRRTF